MLRPNENLENYFARSITNILPSAPDHDGAIIAQGQSYGRPAFRIEPSSETPTGKIWFAKKDGKLQLRLHLEAYRKSPNERALDIQSLGIQLHFYHHNIKDYTSLPLQIKEVAQGNSPNILMNIYATLDVSEDYRKDIYDSFIRADREARLEMTYKLDWALPMPALNSGRAGELLSTVSAVQEFDSAQLQVQGTSILTSDNTAIATFKDQTTAQLALQTLQHFKINKKYSLPSGIEGMDVDFYLVNDQLPVLDTFYHDISYKHKSFKQASVQTGQIDQHTKPRFDFVTFPTYFDTSENGNQISNLQELLTLGNCNHVFQWEASPHPANHANLLSDTPFQLFGRIAQYDYVPIEVKKNITINISRSDREVFNNYFDDIAPKDFVWNRDIIPKGDEEFIIHYRRTANPNHYYFLPQVYRLGVNDSLHPDINISLWSKEGTFGDYKVAIECQVKPYIHPKAEKDLIAIARREEAIKYVKGISISGFQSVSFRPLSNLNILNNIEIYAGENLVEAGGESAQVNAQGFSITFVTNLEGFEYLKNEFETGKKVGQIIFKLQEESNQGHKIVDSNPIDVEIAVKKLSDIPLLQNINHEQANQVELNSLQLTNETPYPISVKGVDLTLLSEQSGNILEADTDIDFQGNSFPIFIPNTTNNKTQLAVDKSSINSLNTTWTRAIAKPYGVYYGEEATNIMKHIIDYSNKEQVPWTLQIEYYGSWEGLHSITVTLASMEGKILDSQQLKPEESEKEALMVMSLDRYLQTADGMNRQYKYKRTYYFLEGEAIEDEDWVISSESNSEYLNFNFRPK